MTKLRTLISKWRSFLTPEALVFRSLALVLVAYCAYEDVLRKYRKRRQRHKSESKAATLTPANVKIAQK